MINFPFQNQQQLNLDWLMSKLKTILDFLPVDNGAVGDILQRGEKGAEWQRPGSVSMDIIGLDTKASPANNDYVPIYDRTANANKKVTIASILSKIIFPVTSVNNKAGAVTLSASDVGALPDSYTPPVQSVNNKTGAVTLSASDVGALPDSYTPPVTSVNGQTGNVTIATVSPLTVMPVGYIYMSTSNISPQTLFGGTWARIKDTFLLAAGDTYAPGDTGGRASLTLTESELPRHSHSLTTTNNIGDIANPGVSLKMPSNYGATNSTVGYTLAETAETGDGDEFSILPPYLAVYVWQRTA